MLNIPREHLKCPMHNATDCSPILNGCSIPIRLGKAYEAGFGAGYEEALTDTFHPDFGTAYREPDGECHKAFEAGKASVLAQQPKRRDGKW